MGQTLISSHHSQRCLYPKCFPDLPPCLLSSITFLPARKNSGSSRAGKTYTEETHSAALTSSSYTQWPLSSQSQSNPSPGKWSQNTSIPKLSVFHSSLPLPPAGDKHPRGYHKRDTHPQRKGPGQGTWMPGVPWPGQRHRAGTTQLLLYVTGPLS